MAQQIGRDHGPEARGQGRADRRPEAVVDAERVQQDDGCAHARSSRAGRRGAPSGGGVPALFMVMAKVV